MGNQYTIISSAEPVRARFDRKVKVLENGCWEWQGSRNRRGNKGARVGTLKLADGKMVSAHRLSFELHKGPIPPGAMILHSCDYRLCVNPDHLSAGTHWQNMAEAVERNRMPKGSRNHNSKLDEEKVRELRALWARGITVTELCRVYKVSPACASMAIARYTWSHVE